VEAEQNLGRQRARTGAHEREHSAPGLCQEPGCHVLAIHCERHSREPTRTVLEGVIRELEFESPERWGPVIEGLRGVISTEPT
jgi:hypothetical protein